jgi:tRNA threonylcarbamoyladenosine biosynthesis protein TsaB
MLILGVDSSGKHGSIALVQCGPDGSRSLELVALDGGAFSAQLVPQISSLLQKQGFTKHQLDAFAVVSGPGSFTGLRVGLAVVKALAEILRKPIAAVSLLQAVAQAARTDGRIIAALDAGRGEIYAGIYDVDVANGRATHVSERLIAMAEFLAEAAVHVVATPDPKIADAVRATSATAHAVALPQADAIARLGFAKIQAGEIVTPEALDASYIRRTDAELKLSTTRG